ncbi:MAG: pentapeptide repeat-containing protein, partial [Leptolyngbyaceae cyanobacterium SM1_3_5]|nr:pentapeptide repeat-containing protein [Leptolyngbyaceae cyanobacterium SM1_3_5]
MRRLVVCCALAAMLWGGMPAIWRGVALAEDYNREALLDRDFSNRDLTDSSFTKANLRQSNLSHSNLQGVSFLAQIWR